MIKVAICDDDPKIVEYIHEYLKEKRNLLQEEINISCFNSGKDLLNHVKEGHFYHIVFMDIVMEQMCGIETGRGLRNLPAGDKVQLIYMSNHDSYYEDVVHIGTFRFLKKPIGRGKLEDVFSRVLEVVSESAEERRFYYKINQEIHAVIEKEIVFLKSCGRYLEIHVWHDSKREIVYLDKFHSNFSFAMRQLSKKNFNQCERSYLINFNYVKKMTGTTFVLTDEEKTQIKIGPKYRENTQAAYTKYRGRQ